MNAPDNTLLDETLAATRRSPEVIRAAIAVALAGALFLIQAAQFYTFYVAFYGLYRYAPPGTLIFGLALVTLGSRIYSQRVWAVTAATVMSGVVGLAMLAWFIARKGQGMNPLTAILPFSSIAAAVIAGLAIGPCKRTAAARQRAAAAGLDLDLG